MNHTASLAEKKILCLSEIIKNLPEQIAFWNNFVQERTDKELEIKILTTQNISEDVYIVRVNGKTHYGILKTETFKIYWNNDLYPQKLHLMQYKKNNWGIDNFIYKELLDFNAKSIAKILAINTYGMQIPDVLSRID